MKSIFALLLLGFTLVKCALPPPTNIISNPGATSVELIWDEVENATEYMVSITNITSQRTRENAIRLGGLQSRTLYTAMIKSVMGDEVSDMETDVTFKTLVESVQNLRVVEATETSIEVAWIPLPDGTAYNIMVERAGNSSTSQDFTTTDTSYTILGLMAKTFYEITVTGVTFEGVGESTMIKTRTDGTGVMIDGVWKNGAVTFGGQINVFRPLVIPKGVYAMEISISCPVDTTEVWGADLLDSMTDLSSGIIVVTQSTSWQRAKTEVGMNFFFNEDVNCTFGVDIPTVTYGLNIPSTVNESIVDLPVIQSEWLRDSESEVFQGGLVRFSLGELYEAPNENIEDATNKPSIYTYVIALNPGPDCPTGLNIRALWGLSLKDVEGMAGTLPGIKYFVQEEANWYSNEAGFLYGYDPSGCEDRGQMTADVLIGGDLVNRIVNAPNMPVAV